MGEYDFTIGFAIGSNGGRCLLLRKQSNYIEVVAMMQFFKNMAQRHKLINAFKLAGVYKTFKTDNGERKVFPKIHQVPDGKYDYFVFTLPNGVDPKIIKKQFHVFQQVFGGNTAIEGDFKRFTLRVREFTQIPSIDYDFDRFKEIAKKEKIVFPIVAGGDENGKFYMYDATEKPNLLIFGEPGSGKSTILHSILCTLVSYFTPDQLELILADFKMSELNFYEGVKHAKSISYLEKDLSPALGYVKSELRRRGQLLKQFRVRHINKLPSDKKPRYIVVCVDEFVSIRDADTMADLLEICSLGRAYGIYVILSMQRPSHKIISTDVRGLLSVRMGFRTVDKRNALIGECPGSELIPVKGYEGTFIFKYEDLKQLRSPFLDESATDKILEKFKTDDWKNHNYKKREPKEEHEQPESPALKERDVYNDVNKQG